MTTPDTGYLLHPEKTEEIYAYRREWRSIVAESSIVFGVTVVTYLVINILNINISGAIESVLRVSLACLPLVAWLFFSWYTERMASRPRTKLLMVLIISALAANGIAIPFVEEFLQIDRWLPLASAVDRIVGYTFTVGIVHELIKYLVIRYTVWPNNFNTRLDGVAYGAAGAVGFITVANLHFVTTGTPDLDVVALRTLSIYVINIVASIIVGYGLSEVRFSNPNPFSLMIVFATAALLTGIAIPIRAGLVNAPFSLEIAAPRSLFGLIFSLAFFAAPLLVIAFLYNNAERREREAATGRED